MTPGPPPRHDDRRRRRAPPPVTTRMVIHLDHRLDHRGTNVPDATDPPVPRGIRPWTRSMRGPAVSLPPTWEIPKCGRWGDSPRRDAAGIGGVRPCPQQRHCANCAIGPRRPGRGRLGISQPGQAPRQRRPGALRKFRNALRCPIWTPNLPREEPRNLRSCRPAPTGLRHLPNLGSWWADCPPRRVATPPRARMRGDFYRTSRGTSIRRKTTARRGVSQTSVFETQGAAAAAALDSVRALGVGADTPPCRSVDPKRGTVR